MSRKKIVEITKEWNDFLSRDTYLTYTEKKKFENKIKQARKSQLSNQVRTYNSKFITRRLREYSSFFEGKTNNLLYPLDSEQRKAIITDDKHNLVIAGAGSGKTTVIVSRIAYLIERKDMIDKNRILGLAFTTTAAKEMKQRLSKDFGIEIKIKTFHSLGYQILRENLENSPEVFNTEVLNKPVRDFFQKLLDVFLEDKENNSLLIEFMAYYEDTDENK